MAGQMFFGAVDVLEHAALRALLRAKCSWQCTHLVLRRGQPPEAEASREELEVLSGGRVAVFVRGYDVEGLRSRMVLPKLNYLLE